jgi:Protein of unknown function, DUF547
MQTYKLSQSFIAKSLAFAMAAIIAVAQQTQAIAADLTSLMKPAFTVGSTTTIDHSAWDALLKTHVVTGPDGLNRVDYSGFKAKDQTALKTYIKTLEAAQPTKLDRNEAFAFWANLYNAKTIDIVLDAYPVKSIKDIKLGGGLLAAVTGGPWKAEVLNVAGVKISLDNIEHGLLRPVFKDPRVHYSVNCASVGCPNLSRDAFTGAALEQQLDAGATAYINSPRGVRADADGITASSIYDWFAADFGGDATGVLAHARKYANDDLKAKLSTAKDIEDYDYDWSLNDAKSAAK